MQNYSGRKEARKPFLACMRGQRGGPCMRDTACWGHTVKSLGHKREPTAVSRSSWARCPVSHPADSDLKHWMKHESNVPKASIGWKKGKSPQV